jgi:hypothetical protein
MNTEHPEEKITLLDRLRTWYYIKLDAIDYYIPISIGRFLYRLSDKYYYLKCFFWRKYNVLRIKTLDPTWHDRDWLLAHAMFQILADYVEREADNIVWDDIPENEQVRIKMDQLLGWWKDFLERDEYDDDKETAEELNSKLHEIINIRRHLWS